MEILERKTPKISTRISVPVLEKLNKKIDEACLRRDSYLNKVLEIELPCLDREVSLVNSIAAQTFVDQRLSQLDRKLVSITLRSELVEKLNDICSRKRISRDAFFNRLFLFLVATPKVIDKLLFPCVSEDWRINIWCEYRNEDPFNNTFSPLDPVIDPFWTIRTGIKVENKQLELHDYSDPETNKVIRVQRDITGVYPVNSFYTALLTNKQVANYDLFGFNCYLPDWRIPEHPAELKYRKQWDEIFQEM